MRIHGHYKHVVQPLEQLRLEKDAEIELLRRRLKRLEHAACQISVDDEALRSEVVIKSAELERLACEMECMRSECAGLGRRRDELLAELTGLQLELEEAKETIEFGKERQTLCRAEVQRLEKEREAAQVIWDRIEVFKNGKMAVAYDEKRLEYEKLERELEVLRERVYEVKMADDDCQEEEDEAMEEGGDSEDAGMESSVKKRALSLVSCLCGKQVHPDRITGHIVSTHFNPRGGPAIPCPRACGFYSFSASGVMVHSNACKNK